MPTLTLTTDLSFKLNWDYRSAADLATSKDTNNYYYNNSFANGSGDDQVNVKFDDRRIVTPSTTTDDLDLAGGLEDSFGNTLTFTTVKELLIVNKGVPSGSTWVETDGENLLIGGGGANSFSNIFNDVDASVALVRSGGAFFLRAPLTGHTVTAGTADILRIALSGSGSNDVEYDIVITGVGTVT